MRRLLGRRSEILRNVTGDGHTKPELDEEMSISRSTIDRGIAELLDEGLVARDGSSFRATEAGRLAHREYVSYVDHLETVSDSRPVLEDVPFGSIHENFLRGSTVEVVDPQDPWKLFEASRDLLLAASTLQRTVPVGFKQHFEDILDSAEAGGLDAELILHRAVDTRGGSENRDEIEQIHQHPAITVLSTELSEPFALWIVETASETKAGITVYTDGGIKGRIHNDTEPAIEWVRKRYRERKRAASAATQET